MAHAARRSWLDRILNLVGGNKKRPLASRPRLRPSLEALEDRTLLAANITIVAGPAGTGNLDALLDATHGTITTTDGSAGANVIFEKALATAGATVPPAPDSDFAGGSVIWRNFQVTAFPAGAVMWIYRR